MHAKKLGMRETDVFVTQDLYEGDNLTLVCDQIFALSALSRAVASFNGPYIGSAKFATENKRAFTEDQLKKAKCAVPILNEGSVEIDQGGKLDHVIRKPIVGATKKMSPSPSAQKGKQFCSECGAAVAGMKFCADCGTKA